MATTVRAVVFDMDGLLFNTEELYEHVGTELLRRRGCALTQELLHRMMGRPSPIALQMMIDEHGLSDTPAQLAAETLEIFPPILDARLEFMPGAVALLDALERAEIPKAIATSSGRRFTDGLLGRFQLAPRFDFILTCEDVTHGKPDPEIYRSAAARHGVATDEMLVLEDSQTGCRAAVAACAVAVAVPGAHSRHHDFQGARLIADTLADPRIYELLGLAPQAAR